MTTVEDAANDLDGDPADAGGHTLGSHERADRAGRPVLAEHAVRLLKTGEAVPLHDAGETTALHRPDDIDLRDPLEQADRQDGARLDRGRGIEPNFLDEPLRLAVDLLDVAPLGLGGGLAALVLVLFVLRGFVAANPAAIARQWRGARTTACPFSNAILGDCSSSGTRPALTM